MQKKQNKTKMMIQICLLYLGWFTVAVFLFLIFYFSLANKSEYKLNKLSLYSTKK